MRGQDETEEQAAVLSVDWVLEKDADVLDM
jgi:hypothetical protein